MRAVRGLISGYWAGLCRRSGAAEMAHAKVSPVGVALSAILWMSVPAICERLGVVRGDCWAACAHLSSMPPSTQPPCRIPASS